MNGAHANQFTVMDTNAYIYLPKETVSDVESCLRTVIILLSKLSPDNMVLGGAGDGDGEEGEDDDGEGNDAILF